MAFLYWATSSTRPVWPRMTLYTAPTVAKLKGAQIYIIVSPDIPVKDESYSSTMHTGGRPSGG